MIVIKIEVKKVKLGLNYLKWVKDIFPASLKKIFKPLWLVIELKSRKILSISKKKS